MSVPRFALFLLSLGILAACAPPPAPAPGTHDPYAMQLMQPGVARCIATDAGSNAALAQATNRARTARGLPPVRPDPLLAQVAAAHACDMAQRGRMTHIGSDSPGPGARVRKAGYRPTLTAENIAAGPFTRTRVLHEWNVSRSHLDNILIPAVRDVGIGRAIGPDGKTVFWAAVYAAPR